MALNRNPTFIETPVQTQAEISAANTDRDGTGTVVTVFTAGDDGSKIDLIRVVAEGTTTAGVVRIFIHDGSAFFLYEEMLVTAITPSTTTAVFELEFAPTEPFRLPSGHSIRASTNNAETFNVFVHGGDY